MSDSQVLVFVGSLRAASITKQIAQTAVTAAPADSNVVLFEGLADVPFYNEDIDVPTDLPAAVEQLRTAASKADSVLFVTPEYNGTVPAVIKNAVDWLSRPYGSGAISGKPVAVISASPSGNGGKWAQADLHKSVGVAGGTVLEDVSLSIGGTNDKFDGKHPSENPEISGLIGGVVSDLLKAASTAA